MTSPTILKTLRADHRRVLAAIDELEHQVPSLRSANPAGARARKSEPARRPSAGGYLRLARALPTVMLESIVARLARQFATHMTAEDESLYPALVAALPESRPSIEPLSAEHAELRAILLSLASLLEAPRSADRDEQLVVQWRDFAVLLRIHIRKEEALVFNVAEHALSPRELARVEALRFPRPSRVRLRPNLTPGKVVQP